MNGLNFVLPLVVLLVCGQSENSTCHVSTGPKSEIPFFPNFATPGRDIITESHLVQPKPNDLIFVSTNITPCLGLTQSCSKLTSFVSNISLFQCTACHEPSSTAFKYTWHDTSHICHDLTHAYWARLSPLNVANSYTS